jgi:hypothetical protein
MVRFFLTAVFLLSSYSHSEAGPPPNPIPGAPGSTSYVYAPPVNAVRDFIPFGGTGSAFPKPNEAVVKAKEERKDKPPVAKQIKNDNIDSASANLAAYIPRKNNDYLNELIYGPSTERNTRTGSSDVHVSSYTKKDGTYVQSHYRSSPDGNFQNNWSTKGNVNPHTGMAGTRSYSGRR